MNQPAERYLRGHKLMLRWTMANPWDQNIFLPCLDGRPLTMKHSLPFLGTFVTLCLLLSCAGSSVDPTNADGGAGREAGRGGDAGLAGAAGSAGELGTFGYAGDAGSAGDAGNAGDAGGAGGRPASEQGGAAGETVGALHPVEWKTDQVSFAADDFELVIDGESYFAQTAAVELHSDPGASDYNTLEVTWYEHDREMRLNIYFGANAKEWWSSEIRTYDGQMSPEWLYYLGEFFHQPLGKAYVGDLSFRNNGDTDAYEGAVILKNARILSTFRD